MRTLVALTALAVAGTALAATPAESIKARQTHYKEVGKSFKTIRDELQKPKVDVALVQREAAALKAFGPQIASWFPAGSGSGAGLKTAAKAEIWSDPKGFAEQVQNFNAQTTRFYGVASNGDVAQMKQALPQLGGACKSCHDRFKVSEN